MRRTIPVAFIYTFLNLQIVLLVSVKQGDLYYENQNIVSRRFCRHSVGEIPFSRTNNR